MTSRKKPTATEVQTAEPVQPTDVIADGVVVDGLKDPEGIDDIEEIEEPSGEKTDDPPVLPPTPPVARPACKAYGPEGQVIARSLDGGTTWTETQAGIAMREAAHEMVPRAFTRRIAAMVNSQDPLTARRLIVPFGAMHKADALVGFAPYPDLISMEDGSLDAIIVPFLLGLTGEVFESLRRVAPVLFLDVPAPMLLGEDELSELFAAMQQVDVVLTPTELLANKMRAYHEHVFCLPDLIDGNIWRSFQRPVPSPEMQSDHARFGAVPKVVVAAPPAAGRSAALSAALQWAWEHFGPEKIDILELDWTLVHPADAPKAYGAFDVVIEDAPLVVSQVSDAPILPAMAAGCCIVADRHYRIIRHMHNGLSVAKDTTPHWVEGIRKAVTDSRTRRLLGRNARGDARRHTPESMLSKVVLPFRVSIPAGAGVVYAPPS